MNTLDRINEQISRYALFCKKGLENNLIVIFEEKPIMKLAIEYDLPLSKLKSLNRIAEDEKSLSANIRFGIITSSKITGEYIRNGQKIDFFHQANKDAFPNIIYETIISEFKNMKHVSDRNCII